MVAACLTCIQCINRCARMLLDRCPCKTRRTQMQRATVCYFRGCCKQLPAVGDNKHALPLHTSQGTTRLACLRVAAAASGHSNVLAHSSPLPALAAPRCINLHPSTWALEFEQGVPNITRQPSPRAKRPWPGRSWRAAHRRRPRPRPSPFARPPPRPRSCWPDRHQLRRPAPRRCRQPPLRCAPAWHPRGGCWQFGAAAECRRRRAERARLAGPLVRWSSGCLRGWRGRGRAPLHRSR